jgi:hypothetical protein
MPKMMTRGVSEQVGGGMQGEGGTAATQQLVESVDARIGSVLHTYTELRSIRIMPKMAKARREGEIITMEDRLAREANEELTDGGGNGQEGLRAYMCRRMDARFVVLWQRCLISRSYYLA